MELFPDDIEALTSRAIVRSFRSEFDAAIPDMDRAIELRPDDGVRYALRGAMRMQNADPKGALPDLRRAVELDPGYASAWYNLGTALIDVGETAGVIDAYTKAVEAGLVSVPLHLNRGLMYYKRGDYEEALADFERVLELAPPESTQAQRAELMIAETRRAMQNRDF